MLKVVKQARREAGKQARPAHEALPPPGPPAPADVRRSGFGRCSTIRSCRGNTTRYLHVTITCVVIIILIIIVIIVIIVMIVVMLIIIIIIIIMLLLLVLLSLLLS